MSHEDDVVVIDIGASFIRMGVHRKSIAPQVCVPSLISTVRQAGPARTYFGHAARRPMCQARCPIENGKVTSPDDLAALLQHCYELMSLTPSAHKVVLVESPAVDALDRMTVGRVLFESLHVPAAQAIPQGLTGLLSCGKTTGIVIDSGESLTHVSAIVDGVSLPSCYRSTSAAGGAVTDEFLQLLSHGRTQAPIARDLAREWKERYCFATLELEEELAGAEALQREVQLPDGQVVVLGMERFNAPENALFRSHERAFRSSLSETIASSLNAIDSELQQLLAEQLLFVGGNSMMSNMTHRVLFDLSCDNGISRSGMKPAAVSSSAEVAPCDRNWIGAALFANLSTAAEMYVTEESIRETGLGAFSQNRYCE